MSKPPAPPHFRKLRPGVRKQIEASVPPPAKPAPVADPDQIAKQVKATVAAEMARQMGQLEGQMETMRSDIVAQVTAALAGQQGGMTPEQMAAVLKSTLEQVLPTIPTTAAPAAATGHATVSSDTPMFIPEGIVKKETKGKVEVQQATASTGGVDDAAAALKALKRKKKDRTND